VVNAWSLLYDELYGDDEMSEKDETKNESFGSTDITFGDTTISGGAGSDGSDVLEIHGAGDYYPGKYDWREDGLNMTGSAGSDTISFSMNVAAGPVEQVAGGMTDDTINLNSVGVFRGGSSKVAGSRVPCGMCEDRISFKSSDDPYPTVSSVDSAYQFSYPPKTSPPTPSLDKHGVFKYNEDKSLKDARSYVMSTYSGHYTTKGSNTQTLDLIESVGDAESFCRSNALKYLSRYDKKGSAKNDILKAMHYCLLLYYFSGQTNETETRGYETF